MIRKGDQVLVEVSSAAGQAFVLGWNGARLSRFSNQQTISSRYQTRIDNE